MSLREYRLSALSAFVPDFLSSVFGQFCENGYLSPASRCFPSHVTSLQPPPPAGPTIQSADTGCCCCCSLKAREAPKRYNRRCERLRGRGEGRDGGRGDGWKSCDPVRSAVGAGQVLADYDGQLISPAGWHYGSRAQCVGSLHLGPSQSEAESPDRWRFSSL